MKVFGKNGQGFFGSLVKGALLVGAVMLVSSPSARKKAASLITAGVRLSLRTIDTVNSEMARAREDLEDMVAEAKAHAVKEKVKEAIGITKE